MSAWRHFELRTSPFENRPDPDFYFPASSHGEAVATLQYAIHAQKACVLILGESGAGKTLVARVLLRTAARECNAAWLHGLRQPGAHAEVALEHSAALSDDEGSLPTMRMPLQQWLAEARLETTPAVLIVDNADVLPEHAWREVVSLLCDETGVASPVTLAILALPQFVERLASPEFVRLRRRLFRTCRLKRLTPEQLPLYVRHRLKTAGAAAPDLFSPGALAAIYRLSNGNPALVNQICDNALVEGFSEDRRNLGVEQVLAGARALAGAQPSSRAPLVLPPLPRPMLGSPARIVPATAMLSGPERVAAETLATAETLSAAGAAAPAGVAALGGGLGGGPGGTGNVANAASAGAAVVADGGSDSSGGALPLNVLRGGDAHTEALAQRLEENEERIRQSLAQIRETRQRHNEWLESNRSQRELRYAGTAEAAGDGPAARSAEPAEARRPTRAGAAGDGPSSVRREEDSAEAGQRRLEERLAAVEQRLARALGLVREARQRREA